MTDPYTSFRFHVSLDVADPYIPGRQAAQVPDVFTAGFHEVTGLSGQLEVMSYPEGGQTSYVHQLPVRHSWSNLTVKRGITENQDLWLWYQAGLHRSLGARRNGTITLLSPSGTPRVAWRFYGGLAVKWDGPALNASQSAVAIEAIEIAHEGILQVQIATAG